MEHSMTNISLSRNTNLLEFDPYEYQLHDVSEPELFREMFRTQLWNGGEENVR